MRPGPTSATRTGRGRGRSPDGTRQAPAALGSRRTSGDAPTPAPGASGGLRHLDAPWPVRDENPEARALLPARRRLPLAPRTGLEGAVVAVVVVGHPADDRAGAEDDPTVHDGPHGG